MDHERGEQALGAIDKLLKERPDKVGHDFSEATRLVASYRDMLVDDWRRTNAEPAHDRLAAVNAVLSVMVGGHFPLGAIPWQHIERAREQLAKILG